ncbi:hypothetical protein DBR43_30460 [Pedobacter sp. KBW06]|uniref:DUF6119 family protein n=1 Tax=Pedobacter sp. KBW06 TaxID=2153359 RepID=UPI000F59E536|nr:DUF6119 family protein [Pedobacter sp. KBW06]RQO65180.1 hypothetical protein DBR43_30460 [Pedobacter sp. KBW06]
MTAIKPTIYLIKDHVKDPKQIFKKGKRLHTEEQDGVSVYYIFSKNNTPDWANYLNEAFKMSTTPFKNSSSQAVLILKVADRLLAIPLGSGIHLMDLTKTDYNFGLKTALNCIEKSEIRQIDTTTPEINSQKTKKKAPIGSTPEEFGINKQKDILRGITGKLPKDHPLGESMDGKDSLRLVKGIEGLLKLKSLCTEVLKHYLSDNYKQDYPWIDNIAMIRDKSLISELVKQLAKNLKTARFENMLFAPPEYYELIFDCNGFVFSTGDRSRLSKKDSFEMPDMLNWKNSVGEARKEITPENIDSYKVNLLKDNGTNLNWPLQRCLSWETEYNGNKYILSEGSWYAVAPDFFSLVNKFYSERILDPHDMPTRTDAEAKESDYNAVLSKSRKSRYLFDLGHAAAKSKSIGKDRNEVCDVYDSDTRTFFHVKMGKSSTEISHLFRQGAFSGQILTQDEEMRKEFLKHLVDYGCKANILPEPYNPHQYQIVFALVIGKTQKKDIPFFSKVSFRDTINNGLGLMGYSCKIAYVLGP